jgi:hypothetical protein
MRKKIIIAVVLLVSLCFMSVTHKFYVAIFQVNYASDKKMLQVTTRIFVDDLDNALEKKYGRKFNLGEPKQTPEELSIMQKYLTERFKIAINGKPQQLAYLSNELENNVFICYFRVTGIDKISSVKVSSKVLFDFVTEQQNIIQTNINGKKTSLLLTLDNPEETINY